MKKNNVLATAILTLATVALCATLGAQTTKPAPPPQPAPSGTTKPAQPNTYDNERDYEKAYVDSYKGTGHINARPISVEAPEIDPLLLDEQILPLDINIEFTVTEKGAVKKPVVKTDTDFEIAQAVITAIYDWRFSPAMHDGKAVPERMRLTMEFVDSDELPAPSSQGSAAGAKPKKKASNMKLTTIDTPPPAPAATGTATSTSGTTAK